MEEIHPLLMKLFTGKTILAEALLTEQSVIHNSTPEAVTDRRKKRLTISVLTGHLFLHTQLLPEEWRSVKTGRRIFSMLTNHSFVTTNMLSMIFGWDITSVQNTMGRIAADILLPFVHSIRTSSISLSRSKKEKARFITTERLCWVG